MFIDHQVIAKLSHLSKNAGFVSADSKMLTEWCQTEKTACTPRCRYPHLPNPPHPLAQHNENNLAPVLTVPGEATWQITYPPLLLIPSCFYSLFLSLTGDRVQLESRARTRASGSALSFSNHFINTPSDWLKPGVNFYSSPLAGERAKVAKPPPFLLAHRSPLCQTATPHAWCERLHGVKVVGNAGCWLPAWSKIQGTIKPIESH